MGKSPSRKIARKGRSEKSGGLYRYFRAATIPIFNKLLLKNSFFREKRSLLLNFGDQIADRAGSADAAGAKPVYRGRGLLALLAGAGASRPNSVINLAATLSSSSSTCPRLRLGGNTNGP